MKLPLLLAGPMVRRTTPERVIFWLTTSRALVDPHVELYEGALVESETFPLAVQLGRNLFLNPLEVIPREPLHAGATFSWGFTEG